MKNINSHRITFLRTYAIRHIVKIDTRGEFTDINTLLQDFHCGSPPIRGLTTTRKARKLTIHVGDHPPTILNDEELKILYSIIRKLLAIAVEGCDIKIFSKVLQILYPLMSQDTRTNSPMWDLMLQDDMAIASNSATIRREFADNFIREWHLFDTP